MRIGAGLDADGASGRALRTESVIVLALAVAAALAIKAPELFGLRFAQDAQAFYVRKLGVFVLPFLTAYLAWKRGVGAAGFARMLIPFAYAALVVSLNPFRRPHIPSGSDPSPDCSLEGRGCGPCGLALARLG